MRKIIGQCFLSACLIFTCANPGTLTGGIKDTTPPQLIDSDPPNESTNFKGDEIRVEFDEYVQLNDVFNQVVISPPLEEPPIISLKGKSVSIKLIGELLEDRTYTINFGKAIKDLNENNELKNFEFVFATGPLIDSLTTSGIIRDAETGKPISDILVLLHPKGSDSLIYKDKPYYFSRTEENGSFNIKHLKEGTYQVFALEDQNFNYIYDLPNERIGFLDSNVVIDTIPVNIELDAFTSIKTQQKLISAKVKRTGKAEVIFSNTINNALLTSKPEGLYEWNESNDTATIWIQNVFLNTLTVEFQTDTGNDIRVLALKNIPEDSVFQKNRVKISSSLKTVSTRGDQVSTVLPKHPLGKPFKLIFSNPLASINYDKIQIFEDSTSNEVNYKSIKSVNTIDRIYSIEYEWKPETKYIISIAKRCVTDFFQLVNDSTHFEFETRSLAEYGNINFELNIDTSNSYVFEILDPAGISVFTSILNEISRKTFKLNFFKVGNYTAKITLDENGNGKWDPGDYSTKKQSEKYLLFEEPIQLRGEWELDFTWNPVFVK